MIRRTLAVIAVALVGAVALGACARQGATPPTGAGPTPTTTSNGQLPGTVTFSRTGGIAGVNQMITIKPDGAWTYSTKGGGAAQTGTLDAAQVAALRDLVTTPGFLAEMRQVETGSNCADGFVYAVSVGAESVSWEDCGGAPRPTLDKAIDLVTQATPF